MSLDRRSALKARHRQAIVVAARHLIDERHGPRFTVDELARQADVSRRTVFNHFETLDDVILAACTEILDGVVAAFREKAPGAPRADRRLGAVFEELVRTVRTADLAQLTADLWSALGGAEAPPARQQRFMQVALSRVADDLTTEVLDRNPTADPLDVQLLVSTLLHGVTVVAQHWIGASSGSVDATSRASWDHLLDRVIVRMRAGYGS